MDLASVFGVFADGGIEGLLLAALRIVLWLAPIWLPLILLYGAWTTWMRFIRMNNIRNTEWVLMEIVLPREIDKSPAAMELILTQLHLTGAATFLETYIDGKVRPWMSFEIISQGGKVRFFFWCQKKFKDMISAQFYGQYPNIEIYDAKDYTEEVSFDLKKFFMWGTQFKLAKNDAYPIKTYVDYGLDKDPKEEFKIDPMTAVVEYLGNLRPGENTWIQILVQAHRKEGFADGHLFPKPDWTKEAKEEIKKIQDEVKPSEPGTFPRQFLPSEENKLKSLERSISKLPFEVMIRGFYIAEWPSFNAANIPGLIGSVKQYGSNELNGFKLGKFTDLDYPWEDIKGYRVKKMKREMLEAYKLRSFFQPPYKHHRGQKPFILNTEELATIFHLPGGVLATPTVEKVQSRKSEAPSNLPQ